MSLDALNEAFRRLDILNEEMFDTSFDGINQLSAAMEADTDDQVVIIDDEATTEDELQDSYVGKIIVNCNVCHSHIFRNKDEISIDEGGIVNGEDTCPYCGEQEGFVIIGQIQDFPTSEVDEETLDDTTEDETTDVEDTDVEDIEEVKSEKNESVKMVKGRKRLTESTHSVDRDKFVKTTKHIKENVEDKNPLDGIRSNIMEFPSGDYVYVGYENGKLFAGDATNVGVVHRYEIEYDNDLSVDANLSALYDTIIEQSPEFLDECLKEGAQDVTDQIVLDIKEQGVITKKKELEQQGYRVLHTGDGKITMTKPKELTEAPYYLDTKFDARKSFYNKAMVSDDTDELYSYGVHVMSIENGKPVIKCREDQLTQTTLRHIKEFLKQKGFTAISKQQIINDYMPQVVTEDLRESDYREVILKYFEYHGSDKFFDVIADLIDRVEDFSNEDEIWEAIDSGMIYTRDQWEVYMHYCDMGDPVDTMWENLFGDILAICNKISEDAPVELDESLKSAMKEKLTKRLKEGFNNINVETDDQKLSMTQDENGKVTVTTEPISAETADVAEETVDATLGEETIAPVSDDLADELISNNEEATTADGGTSEGEEELDLELPADGEESEESDETTDELELPEEEETTEEEPVEESFNNKSNKPIVTEDMTDKEEVDVEIEEIDEKSFDELGEKYMKEVYENVSSFKTTQVHSDSSRIVIEGLITFNSGAKKNTGFIFEAKTITRGGKVTFLGENKHFSKSRRAFTLGGRVTDNKLVLESLGYNYRNANVKGRIFGKVGLGK